MAMPVASVFFRSTANAEPASKAEALAMAPVKAVAQRQHREQHPTNGAVQNPQPPRSCAQVA